VGVSGTAVEKWQRPLLQAITWNWGRQVGAPTSPQSPHPGRSYHPRPHHGFLRVQADQTSLATRHTEFDTRAALFPKEQVPPAGSGPFFLA
jgi:hypothetical protein